MIPLPTVGNSQCTRTGSLVKFTSRATPPRRRVEPLISGSSLSELQGMQFSLQLCTPYAHFCLGDYCTLQLCCFFSLCARNRHKTAVYSYSWAQMYTGAAEEPVEIRSYDQTCRFSSHKMHGGEQKSVKDCACVHVCWHVGCHEDILTQMKKCLSVVYYCKRAKK